MKVTYVVTWKLDKCCARKEPFDSKGRALRWIKVLNERRDITNIKLYECRTRRIKI